MNLKLALSDRVVHFARTAGCQTAIRALDRQAAEYALVMDGDHFIGAISLCTLLRQCDDCKLEKVLSQEFPPRLLETESIEVAIPLLTHGVGYVVVHDKAGKFLGIVTTRSALELYSQPRQKENRSAVGDADTRPESCRAIRDGGLSKADETLRNAILSGLMNTTQAMIVLLNPDGAVVCVNRHFETITGFANEEVVGLDWFERFIPDREQERIRSLFATACAGQRTQGNINTVATRDNREIQVEWFDQRIVNEQGDLVGLLAIGTDVSDRIAAQRKLEESEMTFRAFVDHAPSCVHELCQEGRILHINSAGLSMLGLTRESEAIGTEFWQWYPPADRPAVRKLFEQALRDGEVEFEVSPVVNGRERVFFSRLVTVDASEGCNRRIFGYTQDISDMRSQQRQLRALAAELEHRVRERTAELQQARDRLEQEIADRIQAEEAARVSEHKYRTLFEQAPDAVVVIDPETTLPLDFNQAALDLLGYSAEEFPSVPVKDYEALESEEEVREHARRALAEGRDDFETQMRTRHGRLLEVQVKMRVVNLRGQRVFHNVFRDNTELKNSLRRLQTSETHYRMLFEHACDGLFVSDLDGNYTDVNQKGCDLVGYTREELVGMNLMELVFPEELVANPLDFTALRQGKTLGNARRLRKKDGTTLVAEITAVALPDSRILGIVRDVTKRHEMEQSLQRSEERFRLHFVNNPVPIYKWRQIGDDFELNGFNPAAEKATGGHVQQMLGGKLSSYYSDKPEVLADFRRCVETGQAIERQLEYRYRTTEKSVILDVCYIFVPPDTIMVHTADVTERETAKRDLKEAEEFQRMLLGNAFEAIWIVDEEGLVTYALPNVERILGYPLEDVIGENAYKFVHPKDVEAARQNMERLVMAPGEPIPFTVRVLDANGSVRWLEFNAVNLLDHPVIRGIVSNFRDVTERVETEVQLETERKKLIESESRLREILDSINAIVGLFQPDGTLVELNEAPLKLANLRREDVLGKPFWETYWWSYSPEIKARLQDYVIRAASGESVRFDALARATGDRMIYVDVTLAPLRDMQGRVVQLIGSAVDITERKEAETALRNSEQKFRTLVETLPHGVLATDLKGKITLSNPAHARMHGYENGELIGRCFSELVSGQEKQAEKCELYRHLIEHLPEPGIITGRNKTKDGNEIDVRIDWDYLRDVFGEVEGVVAVLTDVTKEKKMVADLIASEARLVEAQRIACLGSWEWDVMNGTLKWSDEVYRIFGYEPRQYTPTYDRFLMSVHPNDRDVVESAVRESLESESAYDVDHRIVLPDGTMRIVHEEARIVRDEAGVPIRMVGTVQDITEKTQFEYELRTQRDKLSHMNRLSTMGEMATGIAHELNQPLTAIANHSYAARQKLRREFPDQESLRTALQSIQQQAIRAGDIIRRLRSFVQKHDRSDSVLQLKDVVDNVLTMLGAEFRLAEITVEVEFASPLPIVRGDSLQLEQVLVNLLKNSYDALLEAPKERRIIEITAANLPDHVELIVGDRGPGISPQQAADLFQPFQSTKVGGMGLGLVISRSIIQDHGGTLELRSNSKDGVEFLITLPVPDRSESHE